MVNIIGHRGARGLWPENSLEGFQHLARLGVEGVEFDVHPTLDGDIVVIHDPTLDRTTHGSGAVNARTRTELQGTRLRGSLEGVPSLDQVLDVFRDTPLELHVELKTDVNGRPYPGFEARVIEALVRHDLLGRSVLTSFVTDVLVTLREIEPTLAVLASVEPRSVDAQGGLDVVLRRLDAIPGVLVAVEQTLLRQESSRFAERFGHDRLGVWVPNDAADLAEWLSQPLRQLTTDRPDRAVQLRGSRPEAPRRSDDPAPGA